MGGWVDALRLGINFLLLLGDFALDFRRAFPAYM